MRVRRWPESHRPNAPRSDRLTIRFAAGVALIVVATLTVGLYLITAHHYQRQLDASRREAVRRGELVRVAIQYQMTEGQHASSPRPSNFTSRLLESFATQEELERVMVLNRKGEIRISSDPTKLGAHVAERLSNTLREERNGDLLRVVQPILNEPRCYACHDAAESVNGLVIVDVSTTAIRADIARDRRLMQLITGGLCLLLLTGIGLLVRSLILRRLHRLVVASRALAAGALDRRVEVEGNDALATVAIEFNAMADSMCDLVAEVSSHRTRLENVMNSVDDGMVVLDRSLRVRAFNQAFARRFPKEREGLVERTCHSIEGMPRDCAMNGCPAERCFSTGTLQRAVRTRVDSEGNERIEEVYLSPVHGGDGAVEQVVEVWRDITDRKSSEAKMAEFDRLASLGMLASGFSHEVNTPLGSMLVCIDSILGQLNGPVADEVRAEILEYGRVIRGEILRCKGITKQFLQLSRGEKIGADLVDVNRVVEAVLPIVHPTAKASGVTVLFEPCADAPTVMASGGALQQVLLNLLINAVQASPRGAVVRVKSRFDDHVILSVEDQGGGVAVRDRKRVFEPFFSTRPSGTGLGLFVSLGLARNWGGDVTVSGEEGRGAIFEVTFPPMRETDGRRESAAG